MTVLLYPDGEHKRWDITQLKPYVEITGTKVTANPGDKFDTVIYWSYHKLKRSLDDTLRRLQKEYHVINIGGWDITKTRNEQVMKEVFGYNTIINPRKEKIFLEKSELQGAHDMRIMTGFRGFRDRYLYVKLLDTSLNGMYRDFRIYVFGGKISLVITKDKTTGDRFAGAIRAKVKAYYNASELFSQDEIVKICTYCEAYKTEFTELDAARDKDGKLYILDNNNMPSFNPTMKKLFAENDNRLLKYLSDEFYQMVRNYAN